MVRRPERLAFAELFIQFTHLLTSDKPAVVTAGRQLLRRLATSDPSWSAEVEAVLSVQDPSTIGRDIQVTDRKPE